MQNYWEQREEMCNDHFAKDDAIRERYASELADIKDTAAHAGNIYEYHLRF